ncbi:MAG: YlxR family protein [Bacilli bacterium]|nr:YlxR family protein [Bacilli bacterium]
MKKIPERTCSVTHEKLPKKDLIRIVKNKELGVLVDETGKVNGRGVYLKKDIDVLEKAIKTNALGRSLEIEIPDSVYEEIRNIINN